MLAEALDDPHLRVDLRDEKAGVSVAQADDQGRGTRSKGGVRVFDGDLLLAKVITTSPAVDDGPTAEAVSAAVRLAVMKDRLLDQQAQQVEDLEASRVRLLAATDSERERVATRLRNEAGARLQEARVTLATARPVSDPDLSRLIGFALAEVTAAVEEVQRIVAGVPQTAMRQAVTNREAVSAPWLRHQGSRHDGSRHDCSHGGASTRWAADGEMATNGSQPVDQPQQPRASEVGPTSTIVPHAEHEFVAVALQVDTDGRGTGVLRDVGQCL